MITIQANQLRLRGWIWLIVLCFNCCIVMGAPSLKVSNDEIVVAIIDTGLDVTLPEIKPFLWKNPGETGLDSKGRDKASNGIDDDNNGFVDDVSGWNFADKNSDLADEIGHGTHVTGIALGRSNFWKADLPKKIKIMVLKYYDAKASGRENLKNSLAAMHYAFTEGAKIVNYSGGGNSPSIEEKNLLKIAEALGIVIIAAAGNEHSNSDNKPFFPANYNLPNIVSVAAADQNGLLIPSSNFGVHSVDLAAPGKNILSLLPGGLKGPMTGTSQATAFVSGALALLWSENPGLSSDQVIKQLLAGVSFRSELTSMIKTHGELNTNLALKLRGPDLDFSGKKLEPNLNLAAFIWDESKTDVTQRLP